MIWITGLIFVLLSLSSCHGPSYLFGHIESMEKEGVTLYLIEPGNLREIAASYFG
ncbi:MAG: hypothetical protein IPH00_15785 [Flavobacteriales bacterium]|jgi:hypothetical protein|nr:hypothetical protein [Flavobacteriales bacterium]MBK7248471.1 hypothetical protein [Flavobacteriales bacterium]QQS73720.1 MAG: hypothetical protein IPP95_05745 [Flavobacteriales bacterium]HQV37469.1 hypothetical protein [Flavobacteriales bacterium]HQW31206.1 hypothetical protein [Flavobacteriales bacterium]